MHTGLSRESPLESAESMQWLRLYNDVLDDPKVQQLPPDLFKHWINLLCLANQGKVRGRLPASASDLAFRLRVSLDEITRVLVALSEAGLLDRDDEGRLIPHCWDERQFESDNINARVAKHRARNVTGNVTGNADATLHVTPPDTEAEQRQIQKQSRAEQNGADAPKAKRAHQIPKDWQPTTELFAWANTDEGMDPDAIVRETAKFRDHFLAKGTAYKDWGSAWKNWMRRSQEWAPARAGPATNGKASLTASQRFARLVQE